MLGLIKKKNGGISTEGGYKFDSCGIFQRCKEYCFIANNKKMEHFQMCLYCRRYRRTTTGMVKPVPCLSTDFIRNSYCFP